MEKIYIFLRRTLGCSLEFSVRYADQLLESSDTSFELLEHARKIKEHAYTGGSALAQHCILMLRRPDLHPAYCQVLVPLVRRLIIHLWDVFVVDTQPDIDKFSRMQCSAELLRIISVHALPEDQGLGMPATFGLAFSGGGVRASAQVLC